MPATLPEAEEGPNIDPSGERATAGQRRNGVGMESTRLLNGGKPATDRAVNGRFLPGCKPGPGNPLAKKANQLRAALSKAVTAADVRAIAKKLIELAKAGDTTAAKLVYDRALGPIEAADVAAELSELRAAVDSLLEGKTK